MARNHIVYILVSLILVQEALVQDQKENEIDNDASAQFADVASEIFKNQNMENVGSVLSNLVQSGNAGDMLQSLGSMFAANSQGGGIDPSVIGTLMSMMSNQNQKKNSEFDMTGILSLVGGFMGQMNGNQMLSGLPLLLQTFNDFTGPEAEARKEAHKGHESLLPPFLETIHVLFDHLVNSEIGKRILSSLGTEKFVRVFADENGNFSYEKLVERLENHSFRKYWISMITDRIGYLLSYFTDPVLRKKYVNSSLFIINNYLEKNGFPKHTLLDMKRPVESISGLVSFVAENYFNMDINSRYYVKPAVLYVQDIIRLAESKGLLSANSRELSNKLADTINLEIIEPLSRVNRAYKYASKISKCDKYVFCLINQPEDTRGDSLPGLKKLLSRTSSYVAVWFLGGKTGTPFMTYYQIISEGGNCKAFYRESCNGFHEQEIRVTTEYVHNEL